MKWAYLLACTSPFFRNYTVVASKVFTIFSGCTHTHFILWPALVSNINILTTQINVAKQKSIKFITDIFFLCWVCVCNMHLKTALYVPLYTITAKTQIFFIKQLTLVIKYILSRGDSHRQARQQKQNQQQFFHNIILNYRDALSVAHGRIFA